MATLDKLAGDLADELQPARRAFAEKIIDKLDDPDELRAVLDDLTTYTAEVVRITVALLPLDDLIAEVNRARS